MIAEILRVLIEAGATPASAAQAAVVLDRGGSLEEARELIVIREPVRVDVEILVAQAARHLVLVKR